MTGFVIVAVALLVSTGMLVFADHPRVLRARAKKVVVVTLRSGATFRGVLVESDAEALVLKRTEALGDGTVPVDGELIVLRTEVDFIQAP